jgi:ATP-dependent helicase/nuclease subunit A
MNAEKARRLEGESLAAWLEHEILGRVSLAGARGRRALAQPKDVALLFRKLTDVHDYLEPLRRRGIRYVIEGERHFYRAREIVDAVNLFRAIDNPHDRLALVGVLRSPLGAASDQVIYDLHTRNLLDYRDSERLARYNFPPTIAELYRALARLNTSCRTLPVGEAVSEIFATLPLTLLAASSFHSEQAVANLEKLHQQAEMLGREDASMTFKQTIRQLEQRVLEVNDEAESVLAEENVDAVRILSIHKSKGLEFPIIVLAGCHSGSDDRQQRAAEALFDWSSGLTGYRVGPFRDLPAIYIAEKNLVRGEAEEKRLLYVAMTRAREHLIISCGPQARKTAGSFASMLDEACDGQLSGVSQSQELAVGTINLRVEVVQEALSAPASEKRKTPGSTPRRDWEPYLQSWSRRHVAYEHAMNHPRFITPTLLKRQEHELSESSYERTPVRGTTLSPLLIGDLAHRLLQTWDFRESIESCRGRIAALVDASFPAESTAERRNTKYELYRIFEAFWGSQIYRELADANILGREVPLLMPWGGRIMEGVIDLIYEKHGLLYLSDFKTDRTSHADAARAAEQYRVQADVYCRAAEQSLGKPVTEFKVIFLRIGEAVALNVRSDDLDSADAR